MESKIKELLDKYWRGETTLEEEALLSSLLDSASHSEWSREAALFRYFEQQRRAEAPQEMEMEIRPSRRAGKLRALLIPTMKVAAGLSVVVISIWFLNQELNKPEALATNPSAVEVTDTYDDPKKAFEETRKALKMISRSLNEAEQSARKINLFNVARNEVTRDASTTQAKAKEKNLQNEKPL